MFGTLIASYLAFSIATTSCPLACSWIYYHEQKILQIGQPLPDSMKEWARKKGILNVDKIRVAHVAIIPSLAPKLFQPLLKKFGYPTDTTGGMCLRYGIYLKKGISLNSNILRHELIHTRQYQKLGSILAFSYHYLYQTLSNGYYHAPFEIEARNDSQ